MYGKGLIIGLGVTLKHLLNHFRGGYITELYPDVMPQLSGKFHGSFKLDVEKCIACGLCGRACPNNVISIESAKDPETNKKKLTGYKMMAERCLYCGLCIEACPPKALKVSQEFELACYVREDCNLDLFNEK